MKNEKIVVLDYGVGNLFSVKRSLEYCGARNVCVSSAIDDVINADKLILPGVGAFANGINGLAKLGLIEPIRKHTKKNKPLLGICLGMQLLATFSEEFGNHDGLNLIPGKVVSIPNYCKDGSYRKVPFIGWARLNIKSNNLNDLKLEKIIDQKEFYLVHSYHFKPDEELHLIASYDFQGEKISAAIKCGNIYGFQFHPEKSGKNGLEVLSEFNRI